MPRPTMSSSPTPAPESGRLDRLRWKGEATFRVLSYYFRIRWNWDEAGEYVRHVLSAFETPLDPREERPLPTPGIPPCYSIVSARVEGVRTYQVFFNDGLMISASDRATPVTSLLWHVNAETMIRTGDLLLVHAGSVVTPEGDGVLIVGRSGSGKTTLTAALVRKGYGYLSDEAGAIDPVTRSLVPYPRALGVKSDRVDLFPELGGRNGSIFGGEERHLLPEEIRPGCISSTAPLRHVIVHRYDPAARTSLTPIGRGQGVVELARNAFNLRTYGGRGVRLLAEVARAANHWSLRSGSLDDAVAAVDGLTRSELR